jgi:hypothetical protein
MRRLVQKGLQDQRGGYLVDDTPVLLSRMTGLVEEFVCCPRGQAFVPQVDREPGQCAEIGRKRMRFRASRARISGEMHRIAHYDPGHVEFARQAGQGTQVFAGIAPTFQGQDRLRGKSQLVGYGHSDAFRAHIEGKVAGMGWVTHAVFVFLA